MPKPRAMVVLDQKVQGQKLTKILARPGELLKDHYLGMLHAIYSGNRQILFKETVFKNVKSPEMMSFCVDHSKAILICLILTHDFGKLNPYFQIRMDFIKKQQSPVNLPSNWKEVTYHVQLGAVLLSIILNQYYNSLIDRINQLGSQLVDFFKILSLLAINALLNHHNGIFNFEEIKLWDKSEIEIIKYQLVALFDWTRYFKSFSNVMEWFDDLFSEINARFKDLETNENLRNLHSLFQDSLKNLEGELNQGTIDEFIDSLMVDLDALKDKITLCIEHLAAGQDFGESLITNEIFGLNPSSSIYFIQKMLASILDDTDVWDAKYFSPPGNLFPFESISHELPYSLVDDFRKREYSQISDEASVYHDLRDFIIKKTSDKSVKQSDIIALLRSKLLFLVNKKFNKIFQDKQESITNNHLFSLTAPTGAGKTLALTAFSIRLREREGKLNGSRPKIIYCLPFVSITNQVASFFKKLLKIELKGQSDYLIVHHHLSDKIWNFIENEDNITTEFTRKNARYFINLWQADIVLTTYVKIFETLFHADKFSIQRFHRIHDSIIIFDEIQAFPPKYWDLLRDSLMALSNFFNCKVILSSATQPAILENVECQEIASELLLDEGLSIENRNGILKSSNFPEHYIELNRYDLQYYPEPKSEDEFLSLVKEHIEDLVKNNIIEHVMVVVNTKPLARWLFDELYIYSSSDTVVLLLSGYILPFDRQCIIQKLLDLLKPSNDKIRVILIATQVIEAGVDISFHHVYRDFAPLDSIVQVAGRCNRNGEYPSKGKIYVHKIKNTQSKGTKTEYASIVYQDPIVLKITDEILHHGTIQEDGTILHSEGTLRQLFNDYFNSFRKRGKNTKTGLREFRSLNFKSIHNTIEIIEEIDEYVPLFIAIDEKSKQILNSLRQHTKKIKNVPIDHLPDDFFLYSINIPEKCIDSINGALIIKNSSKKENLLVIYETSDLPNDPVYSSLTGFKL